jgi:hypothetical protein
VLLREAAGEREPRKIGGFLIAIEFFFFESKGDAVIGKQDDCSAAARSGNTEYLFPEDSTGGLRGRVFERIRDEMLAVAAPCGDA